MQGQDIQISQKLLYKEKVNNSCYFYSLTRVALNSIITPEKHC